MTRSITKVLTGWLIAALSVLAECPAADPSVDQQNLEYEKDIHPILAQHCLRCHGPEKQESNFRVDLRTSLLAGGDFGEPAVVPGESGKSNLLRMVEGTDKSLRMPPEDEGRRLTADEISLLKSWIDQGAKMPATDAEASGLTTSHWSFQPIVQPPVPALGDLWGEGPIDAFVLQSLNRHQLTPSPRAPRSVLIRRVYLDVIGLLPSHDEVARFESDLSEDAYERLIDRVLANPNYGERWGRHWLDVVRFAESNGFETNQERPNAYHYRDWVIDALNHDLPYDQFVFRQLAGDSLDDDAATGFLVAGPYDAVKSPDPALTAMQRQDELADIVNTTGTAFLGLTLGCARCHTHKFDPVLQKDYYSLQAVFAGVQHGERVLRTPIGDAVKQRIAALDAELQQKTLRLGHLGIHEPINALRNEERFETLEASRVRFTIEATNNLEPCLDELEIWTDEESPRNVALSAIGARVISSGDYQGNPKHKLEHINDGQYGNDHSWISNTTGAGWVEISFPEPKRINRVVWGRDRKGQFPDRLATKFRLEVAAGSGPWTVVADSSRRVLSPEAKDPAAYQRIGLAPDDAAKAAALGEQIEQLTASLRQVEEGERAYSGQFVEPPATYRLYRGEAASPREKVPPEALTVLHQRVGKLALGFETEEQKRRIGFARWVTAESQPLTPRVIVNRLWHYHFGRGLVSTPSDFGRMGAEPSHPELLDWLAAELLAGGTDRPSSAAQRWSLKHIHRRILLSATYQQSSAPREEALAVDRDSVYLWRFPPRRLEAEAIRDNILLVSDSLDRRMHGPGFLLFHPNSNYSRNWLPRDDFGPADYRRMVYATDLRMKHDAVFGVFDCPDGGQIAPQRSRSTTPLQALNLLNSPFIEQQSKLAAASVRQEAGPDLARQIETLFRRALGRSPTPVESQEAQALAQEHGLDVLCRAVFNSNEFLFVP